MNASNLAEKQGGHFSCDFVRQPFLTAKRVGNAARPANQEKKQSLDIKGRRGQKNCPRNRMSGDPRRSSGSLPRSCYIAARLGLPCLISPGFRDRAQKGRRGKIRAIASQGPNRTGLFPIFRSKVSYSTPYFGPQFASSSSLHGDLAVPRRPSKSFPWQVCLADAMSPFRCGFVRFTGTTQQKVQKTCQ
jgi:hypothetical protein